MTPSSIALALALAAAAPPALAQAPAPAERLFEATTLSVSADGEVEAAPDQAVITLGVQTRAATAAEAMGENAALMGAVVAAVRRAGVAEADVRTSNLSLQAQYSYPPDKPAALQGYAAGNDVTVTVQDVRRVGAVIDAATGAGANQVQAIGFSLKDSAAAEDAARRAAAKALSAKAALYAAATGYRVARLVSLSEAGASEPGPIRPLMMLRAEAAAPTPVSPGQLTVRASLSAVYELVK